MATKIASPCEQRGHIWQFTAAPGWCKCGRIVATKTTKHNPIGYSVYCSAVGYCPGCLGYRMQEYEVVMCPSHAHININLLPLVPSTHTVSSSTVITADQHSLW